jgi:hypothetical protein
MTLIRKTGLPLINSSQMLLVTIILLLLFGGMLAQ